MHVLAYLRASTNQQDASRARAAVKAFAKEHGARVTGWYEENASGASMERPALFQLLDDSEVGDVLLLEQVDRLSRLNAKDWDALRAGIKAKGVRVVAMDLPTSWGALRPSNADDFHDRMLDAINSMMLDMLAAVARKDYEDRRRRAAEGIAKAKAADAEKPVHERKYQGKRVNVERHAAIRDALGKGMGWQWIQENLKCSRATIATVAKNLKGATVPVD